MKGCSRLTSSMSVPDVLCEYTEVHLKDCSFTIKDANRI